MYWVGLLICFALAPTYLSIFLGSNTGPLYKSCIMYHKISLILFGFVEQSYELWQGA